MTQLEASPQVHPAIIGDQLLHEAEAGSLDAINPATGEVIGRFPRCGTPEVAAAVAAASAAAKDWARTAPLERARLVSEIARIVADNGEELAALDAADNGSPVSMFRGDIGIAVAHLRYFAGLALEARGSTIPSEQGRFNYTLRQPYGVVARIIPFNHPIMFAAMKLAAPLVAGNSVILKPSEHTSLSALQLAKLIRDLLPPGVVTVVPGLGEEAGDALVTHPDVRRLAFIGGAEIGRAIQARAAGVAVKHVSLELGGKNPVVIFPDADLELAVSGAVNGMNLTWQGQSCGSTSRLLVHEDIHDEFVDAVAQRFSSLRCGMPEDDATEVGAIVNRAQYDKVLKYIGIAVEEGARLRAGGGPPDDPGLDAGLFIRPTLFDQVHPDSRLAEEEIFGPVQAAIKFRDYDDAVRLANATHYGLTAAVFTQDLRTAHSFAADAEAGYVWVNETSRHFLGTPFGGWKDSGVGREESFEELESYTQQKNVHVRL